MLMPGTEPVGDVRTPEELKLNVPDAICVAGPDPPVSAAGKVML